MRAILSDRSIKRYIKNGYLIKGGLDSISESQISPNSLDLTLDNTVARLDSNQFGFLQKDTQTDDEYIDPSKDIHYYYDNFTKRPDLDRASYLLQPEQFVLLSTKETLKIPNGIVAFVAGRSSVARLGIQVEQAGLIDAGFEGQITLEVYNETQYPIKLYEGMRIAQVYFIKAEKASIPYNLKNESKYYRQSDVTGSRINRDNEFSSIKK